MLLLAKVGRDRLGYFAAERVDSLNSDPGASGPAVSGLGAAWLGSVSKQLGIDATEVDEAGLRAICDGVDPLTGEILDPRHARVRVAAYDAVLAAPKSVSILFALGQPEQTSAIAAAHDASVAATLSYLERHGAVVRRTVGGEVRAIEADGFVAAGYPHSTSRAPDPHLHSHVVIVNLGRDDDGRWSALDGRALYEHANTAGALYASQLRHEISSRLGLEFYERRPGVVDLVGVSDTAVAAFSRRSAEIALARERQGADSTKARRLVADRTRPDKDEHTPYEALTEMWRGQAGRVGMTRRHVERFGAPMGERHRAPEPPAVLGSQLLQGGQAALARFERPFLKRDLVTAIARGATQGAPVHAVEIAADAALGSGLAESTGANFGTLRSSRGVRVPASRHEERYLSEEANARRRFVAHVLADAPRLDDSQPRPSRQRSERAGVVVAGGASALGALQTAERVLREAEASGRPVHAVAPNDIAVGHLAGVLGIGARRPAALGAPRPGELLIVAGASEMAPSELEAILERGRFPGAEVLVIAPEPTREAPSLDVVSLDAGADGAHVTFLVDGIDVDIAPSVSSAVSDLAARSRDAARRGLHPVVVVGDRMLASELGGAVTPATAARIARSDAEARLVVLGGPAVIGRAGLVAAGLRRVHVGVSRAGPRAALSIADGLARGRGVERALDERQTSLSIGR